MPSLIKQLSASLEKKERPLSMKKRFRNKQFIMEIPNSFCQHFKKQNMFVSWL